MRLFLIVECERQGTGKLPGITSVSKGRAAGEGRGAPGKVGDDAKVRLRARRFDLDVERFAAFSQHDAGFSVLVMYQQVSDQTMSVRLTSLRRMRSPRSLRPAAGSKCAKIR